MAKSLVDVSFHVHPTTKIYTGKTANALCHENYNFWYTVASQHQNVASMSHKTLEQSWPAIPAENTCNRPYTCLGSGNLSLHPETTSQKN